MIPIIVIKDMFANTYFTSYIYLTYNSITIYHVSVR
jgi:hypothetical protein